MKVFYTFYSQKAIIEERLSVYKMLYPPFFAVCFTFSKRIDKFDAINYNSGKSFFIGDCA